VVLFRLSTVFLNSMLTSLRVSEFAIIDELELDLSQGFTVISGETGAGKSILFDALGLLSGARADSSQVRDGAQRAELSACFELSHTPQAVRWLKQQELWSDDELVIRRTINPDGRSRAYINGSTVTLQQLAELGSMLLAIHGQHAHQELLKPQAQLALLDESGVKPKLRQQMHESYRHWREQQQLLDELNAAAGGDPQQVELLNFQVDELSQVEVKAQRYEQSVKEHERMSRSGELLGLIQDSETRLDGDEEPSVLRHLNHLIQQLHGVTGLAPELADVSKMLQEAQINVEESLSLLRHFGEQLELDPDQLAEMDRDLARLHELARKHQCRPQELPQQLQQLRERLDTLEHLDEKRQQQITVVEHAWQQVLEHARALHLARQEQAIRLQKRTQTLIRKLGMTQAEFSIELSPVAEQKINAQGMDHCEYLFSANPGSRPGPLRKIASGGELSRCALALMVATQNRAGQATMIFDEVDAGVGGETAKAVGQLLKQVAQGRQALCVTHLAQVAATADEHLFVSKKVVKGNTQTRWQNLDQTGRQEELARMLGGADSAAAKAHAGELLSQ